MGVVSFKGAFKVVLSTQSLLSIGANKLLYISRWILFLSPSLKYILYWDCSFVVHTYLFLLAFQPPAC